MIYIISPDALSAIVIQFKMLKNEARLETGHDQIWMMRKYKALH